MSSPVAPPRPGPISPWPLFWTVTLTLGAWMGGMIWPRILVTLGISDYGRVYLDSYAILAAVDAVRAGADPHGANTLDVLMRPHVYSDWWLGLRWLGLTREHNFLLGTAWIAAFALAIWTTVRPRNLPEAAWLTVLMVSPSVMLAVNRANNDLAILVLLAGCGLAAVPTWWRAAVAVACLGLATGLKYFPAPAALAFLWVRPVRRAPAVLLGGLVAVLLALASVWPQLERSRFNIASGVYTMGAPLWWRDLGWTDRAAALPSLLVIVLAALVLAWGRVTTGLAERGQPRERLLAALGAVVVLGCFLAGVNYAYRWIFALWPAVWLWRQAGADAPPGRTRWAARFSCVLVLLGLWLDGVLCVVVNLFFRDQAVVWRNAPDVTWRQWTQPLHWMLMMLLAGWLVEGAWATLREWWSLRHED